MERRDHQSWSWKAYQMFHTISANDSYTWIRVSTCWTTVSMKSRINFLFCFCQFWHARQKLKCYNLHGRNTNWCWGREKRKEKKAEREKERKGTTKNNPRSTEMINGWWNVVNRNTNNFTSQNPNKNTAWRHNRTEHFAYNFHYKPSPDQ